MITVAGEALIDLVVDHGGRIGAQPGGGPFNAARTIGRLGMAPAFLGRLSRDGFGRLLRESLDQDGVTLGVSDLADAPTTLAVAEIDAEGTPSYRFYLAGTASCALEYPQLAAALPDQLTALLAGSLALVMEPIATGIEHLIIRGLPDEVLVMIDPNCRPEAIGDRRAYTARLNRILPRADVVRASVEDLAYLYPGATARKAAARLLDLGPQLILVTDGPRAARAFMPAGRVSVDVPVVQVVDTIGAGDAFGGAFLAWWSGSELSKPDLSRSGAVREALRAAVEVAALTCTRVGAEPPWAAEIRGRPGWRFLPPVTTTAVHQARAPSG